MGYDRDRVDWTDSEHSAAESADKLYELWHDRLSDGLQPTDLAAIPASFGPTGSLYAHLFAGTKREMARKLIALGVMLERDNDFLGTTAEAQGDGDPG